MTELSRQELDRLRELAAAANAEPVWIIGQPNANEKFIAYANPERVTRLVGLVEELTEALDEVVGSLTTKGKWMHNRIKKARVLLDRLGAP